VNIFDGNSFHDLAPRYEVPSYNVVSRDREHQDTTFYNETPMLGVRSTMSFKARELGTATLCGSVGGAILISILGIANLPFYSAIGALIGGMIAAYLLRGKVSLAVAAGALSGLIGTPFFLGFSDILAIFNLIPTPSGPTPTLADLQVAVALIAGMDLVAGAVGGAILGAVYHAPKQPIQMPAQPSVAGAPVGLTRYCVQCGSQLSTGASICPQCGAKQPQ